MVSSVQSAEPMNQHSVLCIAAGVTKSHQAYTNDRYLDTPGKIRNLKSLEVKAASADRELKMLRKKIEVSTEKVGIEVDQDLHGDLLQSMKDHDKSIEDAYPAGSFRHLFWKEQLKSASLKDARQMRWHPVMVKWCLNLKLFPSYIWFCESSIGKNIKRLYSFFQAKTRISD